MPNNLSPQEDITEFTKMTVETIRFEIFEYLCYALVFERTFK